MTEPARPFVFFSSVPLVELTGYKARNVRELTEAVERVEASSIYYHTLHYVREHHFLSEEYPSDFGFWVAEILHEKGLGERLAFVDVRRFGSIEALRREILSILKSHEGKRAEREVMPGLEFHFRKSINIVVPTGHTASSLAEFREALAQVDNNGLFYHLIESNLREEKPGNDFSIWLVECLGKQKLAEQFAQVDPYVNTLDQSRRRLLDIVDRELAKERVVAKITSYPQTSEVGRLLEEHQLLAKLRNLFVRKTSEETKK